MKYTLSAFGSQLEITLIDAQNDSGISESFSIVKDFEQKYSRFQQGNILSNINSNKAAVLTSEISSLIKMCLKVSKLTHGAFDITILPILENVGYGIRSEKMPENYGYKNIVLNENILTLTNNVSIEFGSCGKGYMLDRITNILQKYHTKFVVNFGGDMRIMGEQKVFLEDPLDLSKNIGEILLKNMSLASSAGNRRIFGAEHHLIDIETRNAQNDKIAVYVTHKLGVFADTFATALFVTPLKESLEILKKVDGLEALIIGSNGKMYKSAGFMCNLYT
ncbi:FAD:protein FMN transferase [Candidatus Gracilibacteria bacterium]|nr:FAD:protein FMN transferase [Candidatus Gracilibacteria bacterium]